MLRWQTRASPMPNCAVSCQFRHLFTFLVWPKGETEVIALSGRSHSVNRSSKHPVDTYKKYTCLSSVKFTREAPTVSDVIPIMKDVPVSAPNQNIIYMLVKPKLCRRVRLYGLDIWHPIFFTPGDTQPTSYPILTVDPACTFERLSVPDLQHTAAHRIVNRA